MYILVDYAGELAVFSDPGSPVRQQELADAVLLSYAWRRALSDFDTGKLTDIARIVQDLDNSVSDAREFSGEAVVIFDELGDLGADIPFMGRVSAMDVVAESYPGVSEAEDLIRSLDAELNAFGANAAALTRVSERIQGVELSSVSGGEMDGLFGDAVSAARDLESTAGNLKSKVSDTRDAANKLSSALRDASNTPLIGDTIGSFAGGASRLESELSDVQDMLGGFESEVAALGQDMQNALDSAHNTRQADMARWLDEPYDTAWPPSDPERRPAVVASSPAEPRQQPTQGSELAPVPAVLPASTPEPAATPPPTPVPTVVASSPAEPRQQPTQGSAVAQATMPTPTALPTATPVPTATVPPATPTPAPTGQIAYVYDLDVHVINADGTDEKRLTNNNGVEELSWSPDGSRIAFTEESVEGDSLYVMNADGTGRMQVTDAVRAIGYALSPPSWSPDGSRIAFDAIPHGGNWGIYVTNANGTGTMRRLSDDSDVDVETSWSPDGRQILFRCGNYGPEEVDGICVMNSDGTGKELIVRSHTVIQPSWSPDGRQILFVDFQELSVRNSDGTGAVRRFTNTSGEEGPYMWSPDRSRIAFLCKEDGGICVANADGSGVRGLGLPENILPRDYDWSPDGRWIAFIWHDEDAIYIIRSDGNGEPIRLTTIANYAWGLDWAPQSGY